MVNHSLGDDCRCVEAQNWYQQRGHYGSQLCERKCCDLHILQENPIIRFKELN
jgi:hypothetical protein